MTARIYQQKENQKVKIIETYGVTSKLKKKMILLKQKVEVKPVEDNRMKEIIKI